MWLYALADRLRKTLTEIETMSVEEFTGWQAYLTIKAEEQTKK